MTLIRLILSLIVIGLIVAIAVYMADRPGSIDIVWHGWRIETSFVVAVAALIIAFIVLAVIGWLLLRLVATPGNIRRRRRDQRRLRGYRELTLGLVAVAAGDGREAERQRQRAALSFRKGRLASPPLARLLAAQSALLRGDSTAAKSEFGAMLDDPDAEFLGLRGLIVQALKEGDDATALALIQRAKKLKPRSAWVLQSQLTLEARAGEWRHGLESLTEAVKRRAITNETGRRYKTVMLLARSRQAVSDGRDSDALTYAAQAHGLDEGFAPAAIHYAQLLSGKDRLGKGLRVLETAWSRGAHPQVIECYDKLVSAEVASSRLHRVETLVDMRPEETEGHLVAAALALSSKLWGVARRHLDRAGAQGPGPWPHRLCHLMAALEEQERQETAASRLWLERAQRAPVDPLWVCSHCGSEQTKWEPLCPSCNSFATLNWRVPDRTQARVAEPVAIIPPDTDTFGDNAVPATPGPG
ncbi:MAG TPA: heme biosynthesis HemY N-terminal domain-containing protein [Stellaceae bacterium]|nr:heme biosynthesis HemY N-terminal domain-containing protein [Stellaceae bacterium]